MNKLLAIKADSFQENKALQAKVVDKINNGKKVTFKFASTEDKIDFLDQCCKLVAKLAEEKATKIGIGLGSAIGAVVGTVVGGVIGGAIGGAIDAFIRRIGVWLANFLWKNVVNKSALYFKEAFSWFGLFPNRVIARTC